MQTASIDNSDLGSINLERHPTGKVVDTAQCLDCFRDVFLDELEAGRKPTSFTQFLADYRSAFATPV